MFWVWCHLLISSGLGLGCHWCLTLGLGGVSGCHFSGVFVSDLFCVLFWSFCRVLTSSVSDCVGCRTGWVSAGWDLVLCLVWSAGLVGGLHTRLGVVLCLVLSARVGGIGCWSDCVFW